MIDNVLESGIRLNPNLSVFNPIALLEEWVSTRSDVFLKNNTQKQSTTTTTTHIQLLSLVLLT